MPNKKINELSVRTPSLTDLIIVGDPSTGYSYKATITALTAFVGNNLQFADLGGISLTNPVNGQVLQFNGTSWVNYTPSTWNTAYDRSLVSAGVSGTTTKTLTLTKQDGSTLTATWSDLNTDAVTSVFGRTGAVVAAEGDYSLTQLSDVTLSAPSANQVLQYNGTGWVNATFVAGINSLNGLTATTQTFATGTSGTDFAISSTTSTHTFNLPTASATNRGALSSADWSTFNAKQNAITLTTTGSSGSATLVGATLNIPTYTLAGLGGVSGSGTTNYLSKWTSSSALGNSLVFDNGTSVGVNTATPSASYKLDVNGGLQIRGGYGTAPATLDFLNGYPTQIRVFQDFTGQEGGILWQKQYGYMLINHTSSSKIFLGTGPYTTHFSNTGNVLIGASGIFSATDAGYRLDVSGTFRSTLDANINGLTVGRGGGNLDGNTIIGSAALTATNTGGGNTALGYQVFQSATTGYSNTAIGTQSLRVATSGYENTAVGRASLLAMTSGNSNVAIGKDAGLNATTGASNTFIGTGTGAGITTGQYNTIIGAFVTGLSSSLSNTIILADGQGNQRLYIDASGDVGLNITPSAWESGGGVLEIGGVRNGYVAFNQTNLQAYLYWNAYYNGTNNIYKKSQKAAAFGLNSSGDYVWYNAGTGTAGNAITFSQAMTLFSTGNLAVNTGTDAGYKLDVNGTARFSSNTSIQPLVTATTYDALYLKAATPSVSNYSLASQGTDLIVNAPTSGGLYFREGNTTRFVIIQSTLTNIGGAFSDASVPIWIRTPTSGGYGMIISASASQTQDLFQFRNSSGTVLSAFKSDGQLGIGSSTVNASALLDVSSTTKGVLFPRMTTTQKNAITTPATGLVIFDTTLAKLCVYTGSAWETVTSA